MCANFAQLVTFDLATCSYCLHGPCTQYVIQVLTKQSLCLPSTTGSPHGVASSCAAFLFQPCFVLVLLSAQGCGWPCLHTPRCQFTIVVTAVRGGACGKQLHSFSRLTWVPFLSACMDHTHCIPNRCLPPSRGQHFTGCWCLGCVAGCGLGFCGGVLCLCFVSLCAGKHGVNFGYTAPLRSAQLLPFDVALLLLSPTSKFMVLWTTTCSLAHRGPSGRVELLLMSNCLLGNAWCLPCVTSAMRCGALHGS